MLVDCTIAVIIPPVDTAAVVRSVDLGRTSRSQEDEGMDSTDRTVDVQFTWDGEADAGYIALTRVGLGEAVHQRVVANPVADLGEVVLDFDSDGRLLGVEIIGSGQVVDDLRDASS